MMDPRLAMLAMLVLFAGTAAYGKSRALGIVVLTLAGVITVKALGWF